jgi:hypothetical protein
MHFVDTFLLSLTVIEIIRKNQFYGDNEAKEIVSVQNQTPIFHGCSIGFYVHLEPFTSYLYHKKIGVVPKTVLEALEIPGIQCYKKAQYILASWYAY